MREFTSIYEFTGSNGSGINKSTTLFFNSGNINLYTNHLPDTTGAFVQASANSNMSPLLGTFPLNKVTQDKSMGVMFDNTYNRNFKLATFRNIYFVVSALSDNSIKYKSPIIPAILERTGLYNTAFLTPEVFQTSANIYWLSNDILSGYRFQASTGLNFTNPVEFRIQNGSVSRLVLTSLIPNTEYFYRIKSSGMDGSVSAWSLPAKIKTTASSTIIVDNPTTPTTPTTPTDNYNDGDSSTTNPPGTAVGNIGGGGGTAPNAPIETVLPISNAGSTTDNKGYINAYWDVTPSATGYNVKLSYNPNFNKLLTNINISNNRFNITGVQINTNYYLQVTALMANETKQPTPFISFYPRANSTSLEFSD